MRLIDVDKVINSMQKCLDENPDKKDSVAYFAFETLITALKQEPTVDAVPVVHGRKFLGRHPTNVVLTHQCSKCAAYMLPQDNYCPNCGATMDLEVKDV